jgi:hypothetical protein
VNGGVLPELTCKTAIAAFGQHGAVELSYLAPDVTYVSLNYDNPDLKKIMPWAGTSRGSTKSGATPPDSLFHAAPERPLPADD